MSDALQTRLTALRSRIDAAARASGREPGSVQLVAVSKTRTVDEIREAYSLGLRDFGENYIQELCTKRATLAALPGLRWHMIGHVQTNKARVLLDAPDAPVVHTVDSARLAQELARRASSKVRVLVQVNVGGEAQKAGCAPAELAAVLSAARGCPELVLEGLMTVPPHTEDPTDAKPFFEQLVALREAHGGASALPVLSMGMTQDLEVAIAAGATLVRVGTALFGERAALR